MKTAVNVLALVALVFLANPLNAKPIKAEQSVSLSERIDRIRGSIVKVTVNFEDVAPVTGSGFIVSKDGYIVTAYHVLNPPGKRTARKINRAEIKISLPIPPISKPRGGTVTASWEDFTATVVATDELHDIAILSAPNVMTRKTTAIYRGVSSEIGTKVSHARLSAVPIRDGDPVFVSGYPLGVPVLVTNSGFVASSAPVQTDPATRKLLDLYWLDLQANHGNSGGPVVSLNTGDVIAMQVTVYLAQVEYMDKPGELVSLPQIGPDGQISASERIGYNAGIAQAISAKYIEDLLIKNQIMF